MVNANILKTLALYGELETGGVTDACNLIARLINKKNNSVYTVYYPTEYNLEYALSAALKAGVNCNAIDEADLVSRIISQQNKDGSWSSEIPNNDLQATLYAVNTLLNIMTFSRTESMKNVERAIDYVLSNEIKDGSMSHWKAGIFFSGGTIMKKTHVWRSDAYTTALVVEMLNKYLLLNERENQITKTE